ncbi:hypothetical protein DSUL_150035 [Desulfovibrionales bacterium]
MSLFNVLQYLDIAKNFEKILSSFPSNIYISFAILYMFYLVLVEKQFRYYSGLKICAYR